MQYEKKGFGYVYQNITRSKQLTAESKAIYAYLASFSGNSEMCYPSIQLMLNELGMSKTRFYKHMGLLIEKGIVTKQQEKQENRFCKNTYIISSFPSFEDTRIEDTQNRDTQIEDTQNLTTNSNSIKTNSIKRNNNKTNSIKDIIVETAKALPTLSKFTDDSFELKVVETIIHSCLEIYPNSKVPSTRAEKEKWGIEVSRMLEIDKRTEDEIISTLKFATTDSFWKSNIRSTKKFREKYETLCIQSKQKKQGNKSNKGQQLQDDFVENMKGWLLNDTTGVSESNGYT